ncbi:hypothetical protein HAX54_052274 [Datura stramonium]|uniref:FRIGIDA-like protein n=1 Tax=Datura stramonium TaxID=4076 RepID=A0ABS8T0J7_DATST|nr:hypothetical protein [Datura stramonium]
MDNSAAATLVSQPPLATQQVQDEQNQSELQQPRSQESIIANLRTLSDSLSAFQQCFNDLQRHIDSIRTSINSMLLPPHTTNTTPLPASSSKPAAAPPAPVPEPEPSWDSDPSEEVEEEEDEGEVNKVEKEEYDEGEENKVEKEEYNEGEENKVEKEEYDEGEGEGEADRVKSPRSELEIFCETMDSLALRKYMITHLSDIRGLLEEVPKALRLSPSPASLVFKCIGKFYIQGGKGYVNDSPLIGGRKAKVLLLECFLLMMEIHDKGVEIEEWVKEEAEQAALAWLKRMNLEGGILQAQERDARGLLLLIGCFGIPDKFTNANIRNLLQVSNLKWISGALRRSNVLMAKIPEIIEEMVANKTVVKAVHIAYSVGMQEKFNPKTLLKLFLRESKNSFDKMKGSQGANQGNIGVKRKYLSDLKSVIKCLEFHKIDPSKILAGWQINTRIKRLEKEIAEFNKQITYQKTAQQNAGLLKRKIDETEWLRNKEVKHSHFSNPWPPQQQRIVNHVVSNNTLLEGGGITGHNYDYSMSPPVFHGPIAGSIHENVVGSLAGPVGGMSMGGPGAGISASADSIHAGMDVVPQGASYAGGHGGGRVDSLPRQIGSHAGQLYGSHGDATMYERLSSNRHAHRSNTITGNACSPVPYMESSKGLPNTIPGNANRPSPYLEGSSGLPNAIPPPYQFADAVPATDLFQNSDSQAVDAHPSSSLYWQR